MGRNNVSSSHQFFSPFTRKFSTGPLPFLWHPTPSKPPPDTGSRVAPSLLCSRPLLGYLELFFAANILEGTLCKCGGVLPLMQQEIREDFSSHSYSFFFRLFLVFIEALIRGNTNIMCCNWEEELQLSKNGLILAVFKYFTAGWRWCLTIATRQEIMFPFALQQIPGVGASLGEIYFPATLS